MADNVNDIIKKRLAARAASKLDVELPAPGLKGRFGLSAIDPDAYVRDFAPTLPHTPPLELSARELADDATEGYRNRDYAQDDREIAIREQMERLNEAPEGGLAVFQQMKEGGGFLSKDGSIYYIEPEGNFMMVRDPRGNLEAFAASAVGNMLERQAAQHRLQGGELPKTQEPKKVVLKGPTKAETDNLIGNFKDRIRSVRQIKESDKVYSALEQIAKESTDAYVAPASTPEQKVPAIGLDPDKGKVDMVMAIATYGREEGKNMVRELRDSGGEIEQHKLVYKVDGETFTRTHPDKTAFDYNAAEIEQAVDVRQKELGAIDVWESKSPALDLQARLADEIGQQNARGLAASEEILDALAQLDDRAEQRRADADERYSEEASLRRDEDRELGENIAAYGEDRGTDVVSELQEKGGQIEHDGATYALDGNRLTRTRDGETTEHNIHDVKDGIGHQREDEQQSREAAMSPDERMEAGLSRPESVSEEQWQALEKQYAHDLMMDNTPDEFVPGTEAFARENVYGDEQAEVEPQGLKLEANRSEDGPELHDEPETLGEAEERQEIATRQAIIDVLREQPEGAVVDNDISQFILKGDQLFERINWAESEDWAIWDANDPSRQIDSSMKQDTEMLHAFGHPDAEWRSAPERDDPPTIEEADVEVSFAEDREVSVGEQAAAPAQQPSELETLKAQMAQLQEQIAALHQSQQAEKAPEQQEAALSSTPQENAPERQQTAEQQQQEKDGWQRVAANRLEARKEAGEKIEDKPFVARARESEFAATAQRQQSHEQSQGQGQGLQ